MKICTLAALLITLSPLALSAGTVDPDVNVPTESVPYTDDAQGSAGTKPGYDGPPFVLGDTLSGYDDPDSGHAGTKPGSAGSKPGYAGSKTGYAGTKPGFACSKPGYAGTKPGSAGSEPGSAGAKPGESDPTSAPATGASTGPALVDHRARQSPVKDQGDRSTCMAHAVIACLEAQDGMPRDLSEEFLHQRFVEINRDGNPSFDPMRDGIHPATMVNYHQELATCEERFFPTSPTVTPTEIPAEARRNANVRFASVERLRRPAISRLEDILAGGRDVVLQVTGDWTPSSIPADGVIGNDTARGPGISHFLLAVGYDRARGVIIVKNSFGISCGDRGYNYLRYDFVAAHCDNALLIRGTMSGAPVD